MPTTKCYQCGKQDAQLSNRSRCLTCEAARADFNANENEALRDQVAKLNQRIEKLTTYTYSMGQDTDKAVSILEAILSSGVDLSENEPRVHDYLTKYEFAIPPPNK